MKRFNWKKILSLVLVLTLVVGTLTWNKKAASAEGETVSHPTKVEIETDEHIKLTKELLNLTVSDDEPTATAQIKLTVNGANATIEQPTTGTTDIIFVMDLSNSMDDDTNGNETDDSDKQRITVAKAAAKSFASGILTDANKDVVRIGIASFGSFGHEDLPLSNDITEVKASIEGLDVGANEESYNRGNSLTSVGKGGTNLQAGIYQAEKMLSSSKAANKIIIILSDGQPTYSFDASKHDATVVTAKPVQLNDGTSIRLLTSFKYEKANILGGGSDYTYKYKENSRNYDEKEYTITRQAGWYDENGNYKTNNDSYIYTSEDLSKKVSGHEEDAVGFYYRKYYQYTPLKVVYHEAINVKVADNGLPAISESYLAKNKGITIYSIAYDVADNANAVYVMNNVASKDKYYAATSGATTPTQKPINDVINTITKYVDQSVAAAKGTSLKDVVPSYMTITSVGGDDAADATISNTGADANGYGNQVNWSLSDLDKNSNESIIINVKIDLNMMAAAYAAVHPDKYENAQAVKEALTKADNDIWFDMNQLVSLSYKTAEGEPRNNEEIDALEGNVPQKQFGAYHYTIQYINDDLDANGKPVKIAADVKKAAFAGENIFVSDCDEFDTKVYNSPVITTDNDDVTVGESRKFAMPAGDIVVTVKYTHKLYKIDFKNDGVAVPVNGKNVNEYRYNATVITPAVTPTRQPSNTTDYTFAGWNPTIAPVTKDQTYTATYSESDRTYTVNFYEENGETLITSIPNLKYNENFNNRVPADRDDYSDNEHNYTFTGWERMDDVEQDSFPVCMGDANYKAKFSSSTRKYIVKFYNVLLDENGNTYNVLWDEQEYEYNEDIVDPEDDPSRPSDNTYDYVFTGWTPERGKVTTDGMKFYAQYRDDEIPYTVRFEYYNNGFTTKTYKFDDPVTNKPSDATVARPDDETYSYEFKGWAEKKEGQDVYTEEDVKNTTVISSATKTVTYVAVYERSYIDYKILFVNGKTVLQGDDKVYHWDQTVKYEGATPTREKTNTTEYTFSGWTPAYTDNMAVSSLTFDEERTAVFTAQFSESDRLYEIRFFDEDGTPIAVSKTSEDEAKTVNLYKYGETVTKPADPTPKNADTDQWDYYFAGWSPAVTTVTKSQDYYATYDQKLQKYTITFEQYDGYVGENKTIVSVTCEYGDSIDAFIPTTGIVIKPADDEFTYAFNNTWDPAIAGNDTVVGNQTYVAVMDPTYIEYTILFVNGTTVLQGDEEGATYHWKDTVTYIGTTPTKTDKEYTYTFTGWKNLNNENNKYTAGMKVSDVAFNENNIATFEAQFSRTEIPYTVKFTVVDGETSTPYSVQEGHYGHPVTLPETPTKASLYKNDDPTDFLIESYDFDGWYLDGVKVGDNIVESATEDLEYFGYFTANRQQYNVKFIVVDVDGTETEVSSKDYLYGAQIAIPKVGLETEANVDVISKKKVGDLWYQVTGWTPEIVTVCEGTAVYKCSYVIDPGETYEVTFVFNNGDPDFSTRYAYGKEITVPADPVKTDKVNTYVFTGWTPEFPVNDDGNAICVGPKTYYAEYDATPIDYEVSFVDEDGTPLPVSKNAGDEPKNVNIYHYGDTITEPKPVKGNDETYTYKHTGWVNTAVSGAAVVMPVPACTESVTYKAVYEPDEFVLYTVTFEDKEQQFSFTRSDYHYNDEIVVPENRSKERDDKFDYTFIGWAVKAEAEAVTYSAVDVVINPLTGENDPVYKVTENITYVAVYEPSLRIFNVYFVDDNGSDLGKGFAYKVTWGETIKAEELAEATAAGNGAADIRSRDDCQFFFAGWTDVDKTPVGPADTVIKADTTFYASYSRQYKFSFYYHGSDASTYGKTDEVLFAQDSVKEGESYDVIKNGPTLASTPTTKYDFIGWSLEQIDPEVLPDYLEKKAREEAMVNTATVRFFAGAVTEDVYVNGCIVTLCADTILTLGENEDGTTRPIDLYPVFAASPVYYTVIFQDANGKELAKRTDFIYNEPALDLKPADPKGSTVVSGYTTTTTTFKGWDVSDEELAAVKRDMIVTAKYDVSSRTENPLPPITGTPTPTPSTTPTPTPTATPTPSATPTPTPEEEVIETPDTPQGPVDEPEEEEDIVVPTPETPQGAPEEEVDLDEPETPQGDLPKTGTTPTGVFFGIGAACIMLGSVVLKLRRREDEM